MEEELMGALGPIMSEVSSEELTAKMVSLAPGLVGRMDQAFGPLIRVKEELRAKLLSDALIIQFPEKPVEQVDTMCAIDGARVREQMYAADLLVALATTVDAKSAKRQLGAISSTWVDILRHAPGVEKLSEAAMGCQEILLASQVQHDIRILDGSFLTPIMALSNGLLQNDSNIKDKTADLLSGKWQAASRLLDVILPQRGTTLAIPKSDSATYYAREYEKKYNMVLGVSDRLIASQVLRPGEMLLPRKNFELASASLSEVNGSEKAVEAGNALRASIARIAQVAKENRAYTTYFKPYGPNNSGNVIRFEYIASEDVADPSNTNPELAKLYASILNVECAPPHLMEPFAQWAVDRHAKRISAGTSALRQTLIRSIPAEQAALLAQNYRT